MSASKCFLHKLNTQYTMFALQWHACNGFGESRGKIPLNKNTFWSFMYEKEECDATVGIYIVFGYKLDFQALLCLLCWDDAFGKKEKCFWSFRLAMGARPSFSPPTCNKGNHITIEETKTTRLMYNCAHLRLKKEILTFEYDIWWYWFSWSRYWLVLGGTGSV